MKQQIVFISGDWHGFWDKVNSFINVEIKQNKKIQKVIENADETEIIILQCGDYGFWPHYHNVIGFDGFRRSWNQYGIKNEMKNIKDEYIKIYFAPGNHENWNALDRLETENPDKKFIDIQPYVYFATFGSILTLLDKTNVMFCGGADSIDKNQRIIGDSWWSQEIITYREMALLPEPSSIKIDWIISHTCPEKFDLSYRLPYHIYKDPSRIALDEVLNIYHPKQWFFGHFHNYLKGNFDNCLWTMFADIKNSRGQKWFDYYLIETK